MYGCTYPFLYLAARCRYKNLGLDGRKDYYNGGQWDYYFQKASEAGIDAILLGCHGGYPEEIPADADGSSSFADNAAIQIIQTPCLLRRNTALNCTPGSGPSTAQNSPCAMPIRTGIRLTRWGSPAWISNCTTGSITGGFAPPSGNHTVPERTRCRAGFYKGLAGVHLDFIRYPDAILPYGLHQSRNVVQDKVPVVGFLLL